MADDEQAQLQDVLEDLGDDNAQEERDQLQAQLFGAEDEPEDVVAGLEDEDEDAGAEEEVAAGPSQSKDDRKNSLKLLAKKRKQEEASDLCMPLTLLPPSRWGPELRHDVLRDGAGS